MPARKPRPDEKPQFERFIETARQIGAGETDAALERAIRKIAPPKSPFRPASARRKKLGSVRRDS
jgi:hypothetical protein